LYKIICALKPRSLFWMEHIGEMGRQEIHTEFWWENFF
jgi:hypothetical protein